MRLKKNDLILTMMFLMGASLNHAVVISGINVSFSDIILIIATIILIFQKRYYLNKIIIIFMLLLFITTTLSTFFIPYFIFDYSVKPIEYLSGIAKLVLLFMYLFLGYNLNKNNIQKKFFDGYIFISVAIALFAIMLNIFNLSMFNDVLYYSNERLKGFMNDPNYFSIVQLIGLAIVVNKKFDIKIKKILYITLIIISILMSGSKTGAITLIMYLVYRITVNLIFSKNLKNVLVLLFIPTFLIILLSVNEYIYINFFESIATIIPGFERVILVFTDFRNAFNSGGSTRNEAIFTALNIIKASPIFGIGVGVYTSISKSRFGVDVIAHNTYLQLMVEWGILMFGSFLILIVYYLKKYFSEFGILKNHIIDIIFVVSMASLAISLNNARMFWIVLGLMIYKTVNTKGKKTNENFNVSL